jgi:hypothetical protein
VHFRLLQAPNAHILKYFTRKSFRIKDHSKIPPNSMILKDRARRGPTTRAISSESGENLVKRLNGRISP